jgi:sec-independent protein translocase protein TatA
MPFGFHPVELLIVLALALLFFGPKRLPEMGSSIGKTIKEFQKSMKEVNQPTNEAPAALPPAPQPEVRSIAAPTATVTAESVHVVPETAPAERVRVVPVTVPAERPGE